MEPKRIACIGYRDWAFRIYNALRNAGHTVETLRLSSDYDRREYEQNRDVYLRPHGDGYIDPEKYDYVLWYGWSERIESHYVSAGNSIMLHPSPLPKYRGGSPIQNQIINGELNSAVTLFMVHEGMDTGDIIRQSYLPLTGTLDDVIDRIVDIGTNLTLDVLKYGFVGIPQNHEEATYCTRRKPEQSEITIEEIQNMTSVELYNKVRCLQPPYPQAFIRAADGKKVYLDSVSIGRDDEKH